MSLTTNKPQEGGVQMKSKLLVFTAVLVFGVSVYSFAAEEAATTATENAAQENVQAATPMETAMDLAMVNNKICPISGDKIGKMGETKVVEYNGKKYNLCCAMCEKDFMKDPAAAVKKIEDQMTAEAAPAADVPAAAPDMAK